jgi:hypothetical protein
MALHIPHLTALKCELGWKWKSIELELQYNMNYRIETYIRGNKYRNLDQDEKQGMSVLTAT